MARELAFAMINPYSLAKSRTGGILGRFLSRTGLDLVAARMFGPSRELAEAYARQIEEEAVPTSQTAPLLADYVRRAYGPEPASGRRRRVMLLLFEGEDAVAKIAATAGPVRANSVSGETVRDTYGDFIVGSDGEVRYIEPAVMVAPTVESAARTLRMWAQYSAQDGGVVDNAADVDPTGIERTLVLIKPDNFRYPSARPGSVVDILSRSGLRIVAAKVHRMSVAEAEEFYGPVRPVLREKMKGVVMQKLAHLIESELGMEVPEELRVRLGELVGPYYGDQQFFNIIHFMTGRWPQKCAPEAKTEPGLERCLALMYAGPDAVAKIRRLLGPTDPSQAAPGTVRRELGQDVMVNAAHASDSRENAAREAAIIRIEEDLVTPWVRRYYGD
ncbi:MAG: nucleoside-diphosphate kinase [Kiritimatiellae bacterium]|nr:nucleoside-diphosphate kinase [Kiritimatiellia bacterium]